MVTLGSQTPVQTQPTPKDSSTVQD
uniref:Uncharacterized protein n=1 Tax=Mus musculus TaxID=10090 RepID=Q8CEE9_MOUSE|nr:unnamed protein product [Mus musculus]